MTESDKFLARRTPLQRKLDEIRSRGHYEDAEERRARRLWDDELDAMKAKISRERAGWPMAGTAEERAGKRSTRANE